MHPERKRQQRQRHYLVPLLCLCLCLALTPSRGADACPAGCQCGLDTVQCENSVQRTHVPTSLPANDTVTTLVITGASIVTLNASAFANLRNLKILELNNDHLDSIEDGAFRELENLEMLVLRRNFLTNLSNATFDGLATLRRLELSYNHLVDLGQDYFRPLGALQVLDLARNQIEHISSEAFRGLGALRVLNLTRNSLVAVSHDVLRPLTALQNLIMDDNDIKVIEDSAFSSLLSLRRLTLIGNKGLTRFQSEAFVNASSSTSSSSSSSSSGLNSEPVAFPLEELLLKGTKLTSPPVSAFRHLPQLTSLDLSLTAIAVIENGSFRNLQLLVNLTLDSLPRLAKIEDGAFFGLRRLQNLKATNNRMLQEVHGAVFRDLSGLQYLDLRNNGMTTLRYGLADWTKIKVVDLRGNPILCDCHAAWMLGLLLPAANSSGPDAEGVGVGEGVGGAGVVLEANCSAEFTAGSSSVNGDTPARVSTGYFARQMACHMPARLHKRCLSTMTKEDFRCASTPEPQSLDDTDQRLKVGVMATCVTAVFLLCCALFLKFRRRVCSACRRQYRYKAQRNHQHHALNGGSPSTEIVELETTQLEDFEDDLDTSVKI